jgi:hypothetical protein
MSYKEAVRINNSARRRHTLSEEAPDSVFKLEQLANSHCRENFNSNSFVSTDRTIDTSKSPSERCINTGGLTNAGL